MDKTIPKIYKELLSKSGKSPMSELLPLVLQLSRLLKNQDLEKWALLELNGYLDNNPAMTDDVIVPEYRTVTGQHSDDYGRPLLIRDPKLSLVNEDRLRYGVSELELLASRSDAISVRSPGLSQIIREHLNIDVSIFSFSPVHVAGVLTGIRTKLIDWLDEIQGEIDDLHTTILNSTETNDGQTTFDRILHAIKDNQFWAIVLIFGLAIIALGNFTGALDQIIKSFSSPKSQETNHAQSIEVVSVTMNVTLTILVDHELRDFNGTIASRSEKCFLETRSGDKLPLISSPGSTRMTRSGKRYSFSFDGILPQGHNLYRTLPEEFIDSREVFVPLTAFVSLAKKKMPIKSIPVLESLEATLYVNGKRVSKGKYSDAKPVDMDAVISVTLTKLY